VRGFFPCPDTNNDGVENTGCSATETEGYLPYASLGGIGEKDNWGNHFRYRVDRRYATYATTISTSYHTTLDGLKIFKLDGTTRLDTFDENNQSRIVAVVFSCGKNGVPDAKNAQNGGTTCSNSMTPSNATYTQDVIMANFDDILMWISKYTVIHELANAGKWK